MDDELLRAIYWCSQRQGTQNGHCHNRKTLQQVWESCLWTKRGGVLQFLVKVLQEARRFQVQLFVEDFGRISAARQNATMRIPLRKISGLYLCARGCQGPNRWICELSTALRVAEKYLSIYLAAVLWITDPTDIVQLSNIISCSIDGINAPYHCVGSVILMTQSDFLSHEAQMYKKQRSGKKKHGK